jgi:hypothetical protein
MSALLRMTCERGHVFIAIDPPDAVIIAEWRSRHLGDGAVCPPRRTERPLEATKGATQPYPGLTGVSQERTGAIA